MRHSNSKQPARKNLVVALLLSVCALILLLMPMSPRLMGEPQAPTGVPVIPAGSAYRQTNFISDLPGVAFIQNPLLRNPWGIAFRGTSPFWVSNNKTNSASLYRGDVSGSPLVKKPGL